MPNAPEPAESIRITFAMPTLNAARTIERALQSIISQSIPLDQLEILVIDGGSWTAFSSYGGGFVPLTTAANPTLLNGAAAVNALHWR